MGFQNDFQSEGNPSTPVASAYGIINSGHASVIPSDCYGVILQAIEMAARGETKETLEEVTRSKDYANICISPKELSNIYRYESTLNVSANRVSKRLADYFQQIGALRQTSRPDVVSLSGYVEQKTPWKERMLTNHKNEGYIVGNAYTVFARAPNGADVVHLEMSDGVLMSIAMCEDMDNAMAGEWIPDSLQRITDEGMTTVSLPRFRLSQEINLETIPTLGFLFSDKAKLDFGSGLCKLAASVGTEVWLSEFGLNYGDSSAPRSDIEKIDVSVEPPFVVVFSYPNPRNKILRIPTLIASVENHAGCGVMPHTPYQRRAELELDYEHYDDEHEFVGDYDDVAEAEYEEAFAKK